MKEGVPCLLGKGWMVCVCVCVGGGLLVELLLARLSCYATHLQADILGHRKWNSSRTAFWGHWLTFEVFSRLCYNLNYEQGVGLFGDEWQGCLCSGWLTDCVLMN